MYSMALVMKVVLGWDINFSIWVSSLTVAVYVAAGRPALGHLQRGAAVRADLAGRAADLHHGTDRSRRLERHGGAHPPQFPGRGLHPPVEHAGFVHRQSHGHPLDRHRARPRLRDLLRLLDHRLPGGAARDLRPRICAPRKWLRSSAPAFKMAVPVHRHSAGIAGPGGALPGHLTWWAGSGQRDRRDTVTTKCCRSCWRAIAAPDCWAWGSPL